MFLKFISKNCKIIRNLLNFLRFTKNINFIPSFYEKLWRIICHRYDLLGLFLFFPGVEIGLILYFDNLSKMFSDLPLLLLFITTLICLILSPLFTTFPKQHNFHSSIFCPFSEILKFSRMWSLVYKITVKISFFSILN